MPKGQIEDSLCADWLVEWLGGEPREVSLAPEEADCRCGYLAVTPVAAYTTLSREAHPCFTTNYDTSLSMLDLSQVEGISELGSMKVHGVIEPLRRSIGDLEDSNLSRLSRIVRDWVTEAEGPGGSSVGECWVLSDAAVDDDVRFRALLSDGEHKLLQRPAGKEQWAWFSYVHQLFLALSEDGPSLSGREFLRLITREVRKRRFARKSPRPRTRHTRAERLLRLAASIIPHAPPRLLLTEPLLAEAG